MPIPSRCLLLACACLAGFASTSAAAGDAIPEPAWTFTSMYSYSSLSHDRGNWNEGEMELLNRFSPDLTLGAHVDVRSRSNGTDELYGALASYRLLPRVEIHGGVRFSPSPTFSARQTYSAGAEWHAFTPVSFLLDYQWLSYSEGRVHQIKPAVTFWINDTTFVT